LCNQTPFDFDYISEEQKNQKEKGDVIMYQLISDGGCDFSKDEAIKHNVDIVPFYICINNETHLKEGLTTADK